MSRGVGGLHMICLNFSPDSEFMQKSSDSICRQLKSGIISQAKYDKVNVCYCSVDQTANYLNQTGSGQFSNIVGSVSFEQFTLGRIKTLLSDLHNFDYSNTESFQDLFLFATDVMVNAKIKANTRTITIYSDRWESFKVTQDISRALEVLKQTVCDVNLVYSNDDTALKLGKMFCEVGWDSNFRFHHSSSSLM